MRPYKTKPLAFGDLRTPEGRPYRYYVYRVCFGKLRAAKRRPYNMLPQTMRKARALGKRPYSFKLKQKNKFPQT